MIRYCLDGLRSLLHSWGEEIVTSDRFFYMYVTLLSIATAASRSRHYYISRCRLCRLIATTLPHEQSRIICTWFLIYKDHLITPVVRSGRTLILLRAYTPLLRGL